MMIFYCFSGKDKIKRMITLNQVFTDNMIAGDGPVTQFLGERDPFKQHML